MHVRPEALRPPGHRSTASVSRRRFLGLAAGTAAGLGVVGAADPWRAGARQPGVPSPAAPFAAGLDLAEPPVRSSGGGMLETRLDARFGPTTVAGRPVTARVYEGSFPGPTLRVKPGDTLRVGLANGLPAGEGTNLHTHGFHVSPRDHGDNVLLHVMPGEAFDHEYAIPADHPAGLYWYHPHLHGDSNQQVNNGMAGALIVGGGLDESPGIAGLEDRLLVLQATEFGPEGAVLPTGKQSNDTWLRLVNGQLNPTIRVRPGETQRWRILNATSGTVYNLALAGHSLHQVAKDGNPFGAVWTRDRILLAPGERVEVLVQAADAGTFELRTLPWGEGFQAMPDAILATVVVAGDPVALAPLPTTLLPFDDLGAARPDNRRVLTFGVTPDGPTTEQSHYLVDGRTFAMDRVDQTVRLGALEEWEVRNATDEWHPFHIHVNDYQVVAVNGEPVPARGHEDTTLVPPMGSITMRTRFRDFTGKFVYHCHLLFHEDDGMMGIVEVVP